MRWGPVPRPEVIQEEIEREVREEEAVMQQKKAAKEAVKKTEKSA